MRNLIEAEAQFMVKFKLLTPNLSVSNGKSFIKNSGKRNLVEYIYQLTWNGKQRNFFICHN